MIALQSENSTTDRFEGGVAPPLSSVVLDVRTGERGGIEDWVAGFAQVWAQPAERLERLLGLLSDEVRLIAPTRPPMTRGKPAARGAFARTLKAIPDLRADVHRWSASGDILFMEMTFHATLAGRAVSWRNVDRVTFADGVAVERVAHFDSAVLSRALTRNLRGLVQLWRLRRG